MEYFNNLSEQFYEGLNSAKLFLSDSADFGISSDLFDDTEKKNKSDNENVKSKDKIENKLKSSGNGPKSSQFTTKKSILINNNLINEKNKSNLNNYETNLEDVNSTSYNSTNKNNSFNLINDATQLHSPVDTNIVLLKDDKISDLKLKIVLLKENEKNLTTQTNFTNFNEIDSLENNSITNFDSTTNYITTQLDQEFISTIDDVKNYLTTEHKTNGDFLTENFTTSNGDITDTTAENNTFTDFLKEKDLNTQSSDLIDTTTTKNENFLNTVKNDILVSNINLEEINTYDKEFSNNENIVNSVPNIEFVSFTDIIEHKFDVKNDENLLLQETSTISDEQSTKNLEYSTEKALITYNDNHVVIENEIETITDESLITESTTNNSLKSEIIFSTNSGDSITSSSTFTTNADDSIILFFNKMFNITPQNLDSTSLENDNSEAEDYKLELRSDIIAKDRDLKRLIINYETSTLKDVSADFEITTNNEFNTDFKSTTRVFELNDEYESTTSKEILIEENESTTRKEDHGVKDLTKSTKFDLNMTRARLNDASASDLSSTSKIIEEIDSTTTSKPSTILEDSYQNEQGKMIALNEPTSFQPTLKDLIFTASTLTVPKYKEPSPTISSFVEPTTTTYAEELTTTISYLEKELDSSAETKLITVDKSSFKNDFDFTSSLNEGSTIISSTAAPDITEQNVVSLINLRILNAINKTQINEDLYKFDTTTDPTNLDFDVTTNFNSISTNNDDINTTPYSYYTQNLDSTSKYYNNTIDYKTNNTLDDKFNSELNHNHSISNLKNDVKLNHRIFPKIGTSITAYVYLMLPILFLILFVSVWLFKNRKKFSFYTVWYNVEDAKRYERDEEIGNERKNDETGV